MLKEGLHRRSARNPNGNVILAIALALIFLLPGTVLSIDMKAFHAELKESGLALSDFEISRIREDPTILLGIKLQSANRYQELTDRIFAERDALAKRYKSAGSGLEARRIEREALAFIEYCFHNLLFPLWAGGAWDFSGNAVTPQQGPVSSGFLVQNLMKGAGFTVLTNNGIRFGKLGPDETIWSYGSSYAPNLGSWKKLNAFIKARGAGIYLVGMARNYGQTAFLTYDGSDKATLFYSGPHPQGQNVCYSDAALFIDGFFFPDIVYARKIDRRFAMKWLKGVPFIPVQLAPNKLAGEKTCDFIVRLQKRLKDLGYYKGKIDGKYGNGTRNAIAAFQKAKRIPVTRFPTEDTTRQLLKK